MSCGFVCYVSGRVDPTQFFYNMAITSSSVPSLSQLKASIEERVLIDNCVPDGSEFRVSDIEILDFRVGMYVTLESRRQLYSGCLLNVIRSLTTSSAAGMADRAYKPPRERMLRFAFEAQSLFEALDTEDEGLLRLPGFLRVFRADVDFAVEAFSVLDQKVNGFITYRDFLALTKVEKLEPFFREMQRRIETGGQPIEKRKKDKRRSRRHSRHDVSTSSENSTNDESDNSTDTDHPESKERERQHKKDDKRHHNKEKIKHPRLNKVPNHRQSKEGLPTFSLNDITVTTATGYGGVAIPNNNNNPPTSGRTDSAGASLHRFDSNKVAGAFQNQLSVGSTNSNATPRSGSDQAFYQQNALGAAPHQTLEGSDDFELSSQLSVLNTGGNYGTQNKSATSSMLLDPAQSKKALQVVDRLKALAKQKHEKQERAQNTFAGNANQQASPDGRLSSTGSPHLGTSAVGNLPTMASLGYAKPMSSK